MKGKHRHRHADRRPKASRLWRRVARLGAGLALAVQILLPLLATPQMAFAAAGEQHRASLLAEAAAAWGSDALCTIGGAAGQPGKTTLFSHPCPICWATQQGAGLPAPVAPALATTPAVLRLEPVVAWVPPPAELSRPPSPPRGPPLV